MHQPLSPGSGIKEDTMDWAHAGRKIVNSLLVPQSEASFFEERALQTETENREALLSGDDFKKIRAMKQLLATLSFERRLDRLLPEVVKLMATTNIVLKRLCYLYVSWTCQKVLMNPTDWTAFSHERGVLLLTINAFQKDSTQRYHIIRGWALRAMGFLVIPEILPSLTSAIYRAATDGSPYVRQLAAQAAPKIVKLDPTLLGGVLENVLLRLISDVEVVVVSLAYQSFYEILLLFPVVASVKENDTSTFEETFGLTVQQVPVLQVLHPHFCRTVSCVLPLMTPHGQVTTLHLLTLYCRTFFSSSTLSVHFNQFITQLFDLLRFAPTVSVALACMTSLVHLQPNTDSLFSQLIPHISHWLRLIGHSPTAYGGHALLELLGLISSQYPALLIPDIRLLVLNFKDSTSLKRQKLKLLQTLVEHPGFLFDTVIDDLLAIAHWDFPQESFVGEVFDAITSICVKRMRAATPLGAEVTTDVTPVDRCTKEFMNLIMHSPASLLVEEAMRSLKGVLSVSQVSSSPHHIHSLCLDIAQRLATDCFTPTLHQRQSSRSRSIMIGLLTSYHRVVPRIAVDLFRVLVEAVAVGHPAVSTSTVQLEIINLGLSLWSFYRLSSDEQGGGSDLISLGSPSPPERKSSQEVYEKLNRLFCFLLAHLRSTAEDHCIRETCWLFFQLIDGTQNTTTGGTTAWDTPCLGIARGHVAGILGSSGHTANQSQPFTDLMVDGSTSRQDGHHSVESTTPSYAPTTISAATQHRFNGHIPLPEFIKTQGNGDGRIEPSDAVRVATVRRTVDEDKREKVSGQKVGDDDNELEEFYKVTQDEIRLAMGRSRSSSDSAHPLHRLFGSQFPSPQRQAPHQRGEVVFGEGDESDEDADGTHHPSTSSLPPPPPGYSQYPLPSESSTGNKSDEDQSIDDGDWEQIRRSVVRNPPLLSKNTNQSD